MSNKKEKGNLKKKLVHNYRLIISTEDTYEEKFSMSLNRLNVFVAGGIIAVILITITTLLIAFTPLKEYIPGYDPIALRQKAHRLTLATDSLENILDQNQAYINNLTLILTGEIDSVEALRLNQINKIDTVVQPDKNIDFSASKEDSIFRSEIEMKERYNITEGDKKQGFVLVAPISGNITSKYDSKEKHYAIDIAVEKGTPVKAVADGTVIFSEWTSSTGNVIIIDHGNKLISVYKHNRDSTVEQGDFVESGEAIASAGSSGELSTGPHLHFELWYNGYPVNPTDYIDFKL